MAAVQDAFKKGIKTFVIGLGDEVGAEHLQALANAGAGQPVALSPGMMQHLTGECAIPADQLKAQYTAAGGNAHFFTPTNLKELANDFSVVIGAVRSCKFTLAGKVQVDNAGQGHVRAAAHADRQGVSGRHHRGGLKHNSADASTDSRVSAVRASGGRPGPTRRGGQASPEPT